MRQRVIPLVLIGLGLGSMLTGGCAATRQIVPLAQGGKARRRHLATEGTEDTEREGQVLGR